MKPYCCHTDATMLETEIVKCSGWNAQTKPHQFKRGLSATDALKVSNENNVMVFRQDHEITAIPGDLGYAKRQ